MLRALDTVKLSVPISLASINIRSFAKKKNNLNILTSFCLYVCRDWPPVLLPPALAAAAAHGLVLPDAAAAAVVVAAVLGDVDHVHAVARGHAQT